jgi:hypothetical protein
VRYPQGGGKVPAQQAPTHQRRTAANQAPAFPQAGDQLKRYKQSAVPLHLREALLNIAERSTTDKSTKAYINEVLDACHDDLRAMLDG